MIPGTVYDYKDPWKGKTYQDGKVYHFVGGFDPRSGQTFSLEEVKKLLGPAQSTSTDTGTGSSGSGTTSGQ